MPREQKTTTCQVKKKGRGRRIIKSFRDPPRSPQRLQPSSKMCNFSPFHDHRHQGKGISQKGCLGKEGKEGKGLVYCWRKDFYSP